MSSTPQAISEQQTPQPPYSARSSSVMLGRQDYTSVLLRLIGMELYKLRRRAMSKVFSIISLVVVIGAFLVISLATIYVVNSPPTSFVPPSCAKTNNAPGCTNQQFSQTQEIQAQQSTLQSVSDPLRLPTSLNIVTAVIDFIGEILIIILAGSIVGGEYSVGTVRLMFTRGPTRTQFLLGKIGAIIACIVLAFVVLTPLGIVAGLLLNLISGIAPSYAFFSAAWLGNALLYIVLCMLSVFTYGMMALFIGTLGRSTAAGVAGALAWALVEPIVGGVLQLLGTVIKGTIGNFVGAIPDYFVSINLGSLIQNQGQKVFNGGSSQLSDLHALIVIAVYLAMFIGLAWWISIRRNVTN
ncbi:MAG TPA: ABC transporter permease subunit [Ktedonobacteraceae bacterium]|nr:ABC transporter permease subunit [Ktedonobacteraceae bacterium]